RHGEGLRDIGALHQLGARLHIDLEAAGFHRLGVAIGLAGADLELPAVPGAAQELAAARHLILAGAVGLHEARDPSLAQLRAHVRAAVGEREVLAAHVEETDLAPQGGDDLAGAGRNLVRPGEHAPGHARPYNARA